MMLNQMIYVPSNSNCVQRSSGDNGQPSASKLYGAEWPSLPMLAKFINPASHQENWTIFNWLPMPSVKNNIRDALEYVCSCASKHREDLFSSSVQLQCDDATGGGRVAGQCKYK